MAIAAAGLAVALAWAAVRVNLDRACAVLDTPYLNLCRQDIPGTAQHLAQLRHRIARNPGDTNALVQLALHDTSSANSQAIELASQLAPVQPNIWRRQAASALARQNWPQAVEPLVRLIEYHGADEASLAAARLIAMGHADLFAPYLRSASRWLPRVLVQLGGAKIPPSAALPLVERAVRAHALEAVAVSGFIRQLKAASAWVDAYGLWVAMHPQGVPLLYNGGFEQPFERDGFDWEVPPQASRSGVLVDQAPAPPRGAVLEVRFTDRPFTVPLVRQYLLAGEGRYRIRGEYQASKLRMEQGLAWFVRCTASAAVAGRSQAQGDTGGKWEAFEFEFLAPSGCGQVVSLQLETSAPFEAQAGARGHVAYDTLALEKLGQ